MEKYVLPEFVFRFSVKYLNNYKKVVSIMKQPFFVLNISKLESTNLMSKQFVNIVIVTKIGIHPYINDN